MTLLNQVTDREHCRSVAFPIQNLPQINTTEHSSSNMPGKNPIWTGLD